MKKYVLVLLLFWVQLSQAAVNVSIGAGITDENVKNKMEHTMSSFLSEVNAAQECNRAINFTGMGISQDVQGSISMLWENCPFNCTDEEIVENCIQTGTGYQIRNIPLMMCPTDDNFDEEDYQEAVFTFNKKGNLVSFYIAIAKNQYLKILKSNQDVTDLRRRQLILDFVERFRTAYNQRDIQFLDQIFSDDALIITGKVVKQQTRDGIKLPDKVEFFKRSKHEYIANLKAQFNKVKYIRVTFDDVKVSASSESGIYGVTVKQGYTTGSAKGSYHDDGIVFMVWNFKNEDNPEIFVRTWQPLEVDGKTIAGGGEVFRLTDFDF